MLQDAVGAMKDFDQSIALNKYAAHAFFNRGNLRASLREYEAAELDYSHGMWFHSLSTLLISIELLVGIHFKFHVNMHIYISFLCLIN